MYKKLNEKFDLIVLPSNQRFGFFFSLIFFIFTLYFLIKLKIFYSLFFLSVFIIFTFISIFKSNLLLPLNKLWMKFGLLLSLITSPIILGVIYFLIFTPIGIIMKLFGRDELFLKPKKKYTYWQDIQNKTISNFKNQF
tara:strand:+ start:641 stop:1054 length:414 start_codon:yes stop_codon:yes gene_type:complete